MGLKDILHAVVDKIPLSENDRISIKADIDNLDAGSESKEATEATASGNAEGTTTEAQPTEVIGTTVPPAPETPPAAEVGMGIVPEPVANTEADNSPAPEPAPAPPSTDPSMGILTDSAPEVETPAEDATETTEANPTEGTPPESASTESASGSEGT